MGMSVLPSCDECEDGADDGASGGERERPAEPCAGRRSEREYRADCRFRSHDVPWHNRRYGVPAPTTGRNPFSLFPLRLPPHLLDESGHSFDEGREARDEERDAGDYLRWCHAHLLS